MPLSIQENVILAPYTTFCIGGPARFFIEVESENELQEALLLAQNKNLRIFILGGGSNILVSDDGFRGLVIKNKIRGIEFEETKDGTFCTAGAGEKWDSFVNECVNRGLSGVELLSGIPGTVGAAPIQNIGAYGTSIESALHSVRAYDKEDKTFKTLFKNECNFSYRSSIFKKADKARFVISGVTLLLSHTEPEFPSYPAVAQELKKIATPSARQIRDSVIELRTEKGMSYAPGHESYKSAGSYFMNPIISQQRFALMSSLECKAPWYWTLPDGRFKVAAACLIQQAGFDKGYRKGAVGISPRHALAVVNYGNATAREVKDFAEHISRTVQEKFSILLEPEVRYVEP